MDMIWFILILIIASSIIYFLRRPNVEKLTFNDIMGNVNNTVKNISQLAGSADPEVMEAINAVLSGNTTPLINLSNNLQGQQKVAKLLNTPQGQQFLDSDLGKQFANTEVGKKAINLAK